MAESASLLRTSTLTGTVGSNPTLSDFNITFLEECPSGRRSTLGKRVYANPVPWVRIPPPPKNMTSLWLVFFFGCGGIAGFASSLAKRGCQPEPKAEASAQVASLLSPAERSEAGTPKARPRRIEDPKGRDEGPTARNPNQSHLRTKR